MTPPPPLTPCDDDAAPPPFHIWIRRVGQSCTTYALRFEVSQGKGLLRVSRPGVLIVPPARDHGYEEHLAPAQLRTSLFLHVPGHGTPRCSFRLDRLTDAVLNRMDIDVWHELSLIPGPKGQQRLEYRENNEDCEVLGLGGQTKSPVPQQVTDAAFARIGQIVELMGAHAQTPEDSVDEVIEADSDTAQSQIGFTLSLDAQTSITPAEDMVDHAPPPVRPSAPEGNGREDEDDDELLQVFPGGPQKLARHLRRQLDRRDLTIMLLRQRLSRLEQYLRELGGDPEAL